MKKNLLLMATLFAGAIAVAQTEVTIPMEPAYAKQVYYKFSTNAQTPVVANSWDLAFLRTSATAMAIRINDGIGIHVYDAAALADWSTVDVAAQTAWTEVYNSEEEWGVGAFDNGSAGYGWGEYNPVTHHVTGSRVFVLKYADSSYKKVIIEDYFGGYTIKYSSWDGTAWSADETATVTNTTGTGHQFNYFSLATDAVVTVAPADTDWDLVFTKYYGNISAEGAEPMIYGVTGTLQNSTVTVAQVDENGATTTNPVLPAATAYSAVINTIGDDWKSFTGGAYAMADNTFYLKYTNGAIYRLYFTSFTGQATGNVTFNAEDVTPAAGLEDVNGNISFGIYPNPTANKSVTLLYNLKNNASDKNMVSIYALSGAKVFETEVTNNSGFYSKEVNLSNLASGIYIVKMQAGNATATQKLVIE